MFKKSASKIANLCLSFCINQYTFLIDCSKRWWIFVLSSNICRLLKNSNICSVIRLFFVLFELTLRNHNILTSFRSILRTSTLKSKKHLFMSLLREKRFWSHCCHFVSFISVMMIVSKWESLKRMNRICFLFSCSLSTLSLY